MDSHSNSESFAEYPKPLILAPKDHRIITDKLLTQNLHYYYKIQLHISVLDNTSLWDAQDPRIKYLRSVKHGPMKVRPING
jgi:hypothetical protein